MRCSHSFSTARSSTFRYSSTAAEQPRLLQRSRVGVKSISIAAALLVCDSLLWTTLGVLAHSSWREAKFVMPAHTQNFITHPTPLSQKSACRLLAVPLCPISGFCVHPYPGRLAGLNFPSLPCRCMPLHLFSAPAAMESQISSPVFHLFAPAICSSLSRS